ncbi:MAG: 4'-phosphopantetheinyl transferase family protein [Burkholderiales bacterium]
MSKNTHDDTAKLMNTFTTDGFFWQLLPSSLGIKVWLTDLSALPSHEAYQLLSPSEQKRAYRLKNDQVRAQYINAHAGLRRLLGEQTGTSAYSYEFQAGDFGKPCLAGPQPLHFNLSHSHHRALVAMSHEGPVGVDIERVQPMPDISDAVQSHFTPAERLQWATLPEVDQTKAFYQIWTRKEACVKALGWGLNVPLDRIEVGSAGPPKPLFVEFPSGGRFQLWLESLPIDSGWAAALARMESAKTAPEPSPP